jgi:hypothetical protein
MVPIFLPTAGSRLQSSSLKGTVRKIEVTRVSIAKVGWHMFQDVWVGEWEMFVEKGE